MRNPLIITGVMVLLFSNCGVESEAQSSKGIVLRSRADLDSYLANNAHTPFDLALFGVETGSEVVKPVIRKGSSVAEYLELLNR